MFRNEKTREMRGSPGAGGSIHGLLADTHRAVLPRSRESFQVS